MRTIKYAFRVDEKSLALLTQGCLSSNTRPQIVLLSKKDVRPSILREYFALDVKQLNCRKEHISSFGETIVLQNDYRSSYATIDSQIEFLVKPRAIRKISEYCPAFTTNWLSEFLKNQESAYLIVLRVFKSDYTIPEVFFSKGRQGSSLIISLYDIFGDKTDFEINDSKDFVLTQNTFDYLKNELIYSIQYEDALIGVYGTDDLSISLLQERRDLLNSDAYNYRRYEFKEDDDIDHSILNYNEVYEQVLYLDYGLKNIVDYIKEIQPPRDGEVKNLLMKIETEDNLEAKNRLFSMYLRTVLRIALNCSIRYKIEIADLFSDGIIGLDSAIKKFNKSVKLPFQSYLGLWVFQSISRKLPDYLFCQKIPAHIYDEIVSLVNIVKEFGLNLPEDIDLVDEIKNEVCNKLSFDSEKFDNLISYIAPYESIEKKFNYFWDEEMILFDDRLNKIDKCNLDEIISRDMFVDLLNNILSKLPENEKKCIKMRYGFLDGMDHTLEEIGLILGVTRERVRQIEQKAFKKLRKNKCLKREMFSYMKYN